MARQTERYWMAGYTVEGASDVIVDRYCRTENEAGQKASKTAGEALLKLRSLGLKGTVTIWTEMWTLKYVEEHAPRATVDTREVPRRTAKVDMTHSDVAEVKAE